MGIWQMVDVIEKEYGKTIRGKQVRRMPEAQIRAIYYRIVEKKNSEKVPEHTRDARCGTCGWWDGTTCGLLNVTRNANSLACRTGYDYILSEDHQMTLFEGGIEQC